MRVNKWLGARGENVLRITLILLQIKSPEGNINRIVTETINTLKAWITKEWIISLYYNGTDKLLHISMYLYQAIFTNLISQRPENAVFYWPNA